MSEHWRYDYGCRRAREADYPFSSSLQLVYTPLHTTKSLTRWVCTPYFPLSSLALPASSDAGMQSRVGCSQCSQQKMTILTCDTLLAYSNSPSDMRTSLLLLLLSCSDGYSSPVISAVTDWLTLGTFFLSSIYASMRLHNDDHTISTSCYTIHRLPILDSRPETTTASSSTR